MCGNTIKKKKKKIRDVWKSVKRYENPKEG